MSDFCAVVESVRNTRSPLAVVSESVLEFSILVGISTAVPLCCASDWLTRTKI